MPSRPSRGEALVRRVLLRLDHQADPYHARRQAGDPGECAFAAEVVRLAFEGRRDPFADAYHRFYPFYRDAAEADAALQAFLRGEPVLCELPDEVDGRSGDQWVTSALAYLRWRSGEDWRPLAQRFCPEMCAYQGARRVLYDAFNFPSNTGNTHCGSCVPEGTAASGAGDSNGTRPLFSEKKQPQRALAAAAGRKSA